MILDAALPSKSGRISLVPPAEADDTAVSALRSHPDTRRHLRFLPPHFPPAEARARRLAREGDKSLIDFHIHSRAVDADADADAPRTFVGTTGVFNVDTVCARACEVGILIAPAHTRGGLATEALHAVLAFVFAERGAGGLGLHRAEFQTGEDNAPMRGWLEAAGATLEGTRRAAWIDPATGGYSDVCVYGVLEEEWRASVRGRLEARIDRSLRVCVDY